jgi:hypothetical protein
MKKLIVISVIFALVASMSFAADLTGTVFGNATILQGDSGDDSRVTAGGAMGRLRLEGSGQNDDGTFGAWIRLDPSSASFDLSKLEADLAATPPEFTDNGVFSHSSGLQGYAWWKPIDMIKLTIGGNSDGLYAKEGVTGWMFYQMASDSGVTKPGNVWGGGYAPSGAIFRDAFYGGFGENGVMIDIMPMDMLQINVIVPVFRNTVDKDGHANEAADKFASSVVQADVNIDGVGNIALTYRGALMEGKDQPKIFLYYGNSFGPIALDVGFGYAFPNKDPSSNNPFALGAGLKWDGGDFGVKFRALGEFGGEKADPTLIIVDALPYYKVSDTLCAFLSAGIGMKMPDSGDTVMNWHVNPYVQVGGEWGPCFFAGVQLWGEGKDDSKSKKATTNWAVPISVMVSF